MHVMHLPTQRLHNKCGSANSGGREVAPAARCNLPSRGTMGRRDLWPFDLDVFDMYDKNLLFIIIIIYHY